jgi:hypothetical protein
LTVSRRRFSKCQFRLSTKPWVIVPSGMLAERGDKVAFKATLTHQTMIQSLLFGKRPDMVAVPSATQGQVQPYLPLPTPPRAATTLLAAGLLVSTFDWVELFLVAGAVFLLTRDFFSIAICRFSRF